jgi:hypothetical protein
MNSIKNIFVCWCLLLLGISQSVAQISIFNSIEDANAVSYGQARLINGKEVFMVSNRESNQPSLDVFTLPDTKSRTAKIPLTFLPMFMLPSQTTDLIIAANALGIWRASKLSNSLKVSNPVDLKDFESVNNAITTTAGYVLSGMSRGGKPLVIELDKNLVVVQRSSFNEDLTGEAVVVGRSKDEVTVVLNLENGRSSIAWLSRALAVNRLVALKGGVTSAVSIDNGIGVTYSVGKSVVFEYLDLLGQPKWSSVLFQRDGPSSLKFQIVPLETGFGVIGANKAALTYTKIDLNGTVSNISIDKSGLLPPTENRYSVTVSATDIHIQGIAFSKNATQSPVPMRFHALIKTR